MNHIKNLTLCMVVNLGPSEAVLEEVTPAAAVEEPVIVEKGIQCMIQLLHLFFPMSSLSPGSYKIIL